MIWPVILVALQQIYSYVFGAKKGEGKLSAGAASSKSCCASECDGETCTLPTSGSVSNAEDDAAGASLSASASSSSGKPINLASTQQWEELLSRPERQVFAKFSATWCGPCKAIEPLFEELASTYGQQADFVKIDIDEFDEIAAGQRILAIPVIIRFSKGEAADRLSGKNEDEIRAFVRNALKC